MKASSLTSLALFLAMGALILSMNNLQARLDTASKDTSSQIINEAPPPEPKTPSIMAENSLEHKTAIPQLRLKLSSPETASQYNQHLMEDVSETDTALVTIRGASTLRTAERRAKP